MADSARVAFAGPARPGPAPGLARPATSGLRNALPGAHVGPSAFSPCKMPLGIARRARIEMRIRTAGPCGDRQGLFPRFDPDGRQAPPVSRAPQEAPRTASRHDAVPRWASHNVNADSRQIPMQFGICLSLYCATPYGTHSRLETCLHKGGAL